MTSAAINELPLRTHAWLKEQKDNPASSIYDEFALVEKSEAAPDPLAKENARSAFPAIVVAYQDWQHIDDEQHHSAEGVINEHRIDLFLFCLLQRGDKPGLVIRSKAAKVVDLFLQQRFYRSPADMSDPNNTSKFLWRPADASATGFSLFYMTARSAQFADPIPVVDGLLIERAVVQLTARGLSRHV